MRATLLLLLAWALPVATFNAAAVALAQPLTPETLVEQALARHPGAQALAAAADAARARIGPAGALADPMLSYAIAPNTLDDERLGERHIVQFSQALPWPGKRALRVQAAREHGQAAGQDLEQLRLQVAELARGSVADWYYLHRALAANAENQTLLADLGEIATQVYASGQGSQQAVVKAELRRASLRREALDLRHRQAALAAAINALRDRPVGQPVAAPAALTTLRPLPALAALVEAASQASPQLRALAAREAMQQTRAELARREYFPDLRLNAAYLGTLDPAAKRLQLGIGINLPFDLGRRHDELDAAQAEVRRVQWQRRDTAGRIAAEIAAAHAAAAAAHDTRQLYRDDLVPLAEQNLEAARADWRSGGGDFLAVVDAEERLLDMRLGLERARADEWIHRARLDRLSGGALTPTLFAESLQ